MTLVTEAVTLTSFMSKAHNYKTISILREKRNQPLFTLDYDTQSIPVTLDCSSTVSTLIL